MHSLVVFSAYPFSLPANTYLLRRYIRLGRAGENTASYYYWFFSLPHIDAEFRCPHSQDGLANSHDT